MKNVPMRFCGVFFHHNPATLKIENNGNIREHLSPCCEPQSAHLGNRLRRISGEGELYGADCLTQFQALQSLFDSKEIGLLMLPHMPAIRAYLKELQLIAEPKENVISYRFVFTEAQPPAKDGAARTVYETLVEGESLWDIGYLFRVPIETLVRLNPQIRYIDSLQQDERVRLC